jgi:hypothetical protein
MTRVLLSELRNIEHELAELEARKGRRPLTYEKAVRDLRDNISKYLA